MLNSTSLFLNSQLQESAYGSISTTAKFCGFKHRTRNRYFRNWREAFGATFSKSSDNRVQTCCILAKPSAQRMLLMVFRSKMAVKLDKLKLKNCEEPMWLIKLVQSVAGQETLHEGFQACRDAWCMNSAQSAARTRAFLWFLCVESNASGFRTTVFEESGRLLNGVRTVARTVPNDKWFSSTKKGDFLPSHGFVFGHVFGLKDPLLWSICGQTCIWSFDKVCLSGSAKPRKL